MRGGYARRESVRRESIDRSIDDDDDDDVASDREKRGTRDDDACDSCDRPGRRDVGDGCRRGRSIRTMLRVPFGSDECRSTRMDSRPKKARVTRMMTRWSDGAMIG